MRKAFLGRGNGSSKSLRAFHQARGAVAQRLDDIDIEAMRKRGIKLAGSVREDLSRRIRPQRRGPSRTALIGLGGLAALGAAVAGLGLIVSDRERRAAARKRLDGLGTGVQHRLSGMSSGVRERYAELTTGRTRAEADLEERVGRAIAEGGKQPEGLETVVEGRTVYLRGAVADPATVDAAAERAHGVPGVVAVVNLTTARTNDQRSPAGVTHT